MEGLYENKYTGMVGIQRGKSEGEEITGIYAEFICNFVCSMMKGQEEVNKNQ